MMISVMLGDAEMIRDTVTAGTAGSAVFPPERPEKTRNAKRNKTGSTGNHGFLMPHPGFEPVFP
jgi:hypothetical protein